MKLFIGLILGLGIGGFAAYFYTENIYKSKLNSFEKEKVTIETEKNSIAQELTSCSDQKSTIEKKFQEADAEIKLNQAQSCFVSSMRLEAPEFVPSDLDTIRSNKNGDVVINWKLVKGAKKYMVKIEGEDGTVVNTTEVEGEPTMILNRVSKKSKLDAAQYFVSITAVNGLDQEGTPSEKKPIQFSSQINQAPKKSKKK